MPRFIKHPDGYTHPDQPNVAPVLRVGWRFKPHPECLDEAGKIKPESLCAKKRVKPL